MTRDQEIVLTGLRALPGENRKNLGWHGRNKTPTLTGLDIMVNVTDARGHDDIQPTRGCLICTAMQSPDEHITQMKRRFDSNLYTVFARASEHLRRSTGESPLQIATRLTQEELWEIMVACDVEPKAKLPCPLCDGAGVVVQQPQHEEVPL